MDNFSLSFFITDWVYLFCTDMCFENVLVGQLLELYQESYVFFYFFLSPKLSMPQTNNGLFLISSTKNTILYYSHTVYIELCVQANNQ